VGIGLVSEDFDGISDIGVETETALKNSTVD